MSDTISIELTPDEVQATLFALRSDLEIITNDHENWMEDEGLHQAQVIKKIEDASL